MFQITDQVGRTITLATKPQRIVSLVPSQTELLYDLGLDAAVVGITKFCVHPQAWFKTKQRIGGTKNVRIESVLDLHPDLILANKEENVREQVLELAQTIPTWVSDINNLADAIAMINQVGQITGKEVKALQITEAINQGFSALPDSKTKQTAAYLIWQDPWMTIGSDTFIHAMLVHAGFENVFADQQRYPQVTIADIQKRQPDVILLSSEPFPFSKKHRQALMPAFPHSKILLVDGEMFSWYGSRLLHAPAYIATLKQQLL